MTEALRAVLTRPALAASMTQACGRIAPGLAWSTVADSYRTLADSLIEAPMIFGRCTSGRPLAVSFQIRPCV